MALHIDDNLKEMAHQGTLSDAVGCPLLVVEEQPHEALGVCLVLTELSQGSSVDIVVSLFNPTLSRLVEVILQALTDIIMDAGSGIGSHQLLTLCHHRQDAAINHRTAGIDSHSLALEDFGEVLSDTLADAMMLTLTNGGQVAKAKGGSLIKLLQLCQRLLSYGGQFSLLVGLAQGAKHTLIDIVANEPARTVTTIVREIEGHIVHGGWRILEVRELTVVIYIVGTCQPRVGLDIVTSGLCRHREDDSR